MLAACSGGADSTGLLLALAELAGAGLLELRAAHVHHGIRPREADTDAARVGELCAALDVPFDLVRADAPAERKRRRRGLEEAARSLRRQALEELADARGCELIALAHTRDDQAETLLLHLFRGAGPDALAAMRPQSGRWVRPFLGLRRERVRTWLIRAGVPWASDRGNWSNGAARSLVRPLMQRAAELFNESLTDRLAMLADLFAEDAALLDSLATREAERLRRPELGDLRGGPPAASIAAGERGLAGLPPALARRVGRSFLRELDPEGLPPSSDAVSRLLRLAAEQPGSERTAHVHGGVLRREGERVVVGGSASRPPPPTRRLALPGELTWSDVGTLSARWVDADEALRLAAGDLGGRRALLDGDRLPRRLSVRCRRPGDRHRPMGAVTDRSLAAWMRERGLPRSLRDRLPLVVDADDEETILWAPGGPPRQGLNADERCPRVLVLDWRFRGASGADS